MDMRRSDAGTREHGRHLLHARHCTAAQSPLCCRPIRVPAVQTQRALQWRVRSVRPTTRAVLLSALPSCPVPRSSRIYLVAATIVTTLTAAPSAALQQGCLAPCTRPAPRCAEPTRPRVPRQSSTLRALTRRTRRLYSTLLVEYSLAASTFAGLCGGTQCKSARETKRCNSSILHADRSRHDEHRA